jgi:type II secretory pathway pseudopilin PulG
MAKKSRQPGFSLMETLLAVGTLAIGMLFIAGTFLTGIYFTTLSSERTIAAVAAGEAFATMRLYGLDPSNAGLKTDGLVPYGRPDEAFRYPSTEDASGSQYSWAALCRRTASESRLVQCTVFVSRQAGAYARYWARKSGQDWPQLEPSAFPRPVYVTIVQDTASHGADEVSIRDAVSADAIDEHTFVSDGAVIVDDATGQIHRVLERYADHPDRIRLDRPWAGGMIAPPAGGGAWVVPSPVSGGRNPLVAVYQEILRF